MAVLPGLPPAAAVGTYAKTYSVVEAIYGSQRLDLPFEGLLLIGY